jgi:hypothetical protein
MPVRKKSRKRSYTKKVSTKKVPRKKVIKIRSKKKSKKNSKKKKKRSRRKKNKKLISRASGSAGANYEAEVDTFVTEIRDKVAGIKKNQILHYTEEQKISVLINILLVYFKFYIRGGQYWDNVRPPSMTDEQVFTEQFKKITFIDQELINLKDDVKNFIKKKVLEIHGVSTASFVP